MQRSSTYRLLAIFCLLIVVANTYVATRALLTLFDAENWLTHTLNVLSDTQATLFDVSSANNNVRAFLLTGDERYRTRYRAAEAEVRADLDKLSDLTKDSSSQQARIRILRQRMSARLGAMDAAVNLNPQLTGMHIDDRILQPALSEQPDGGISVRYALTQIENEERRLLGVRTHDSMVARRKVIFALSAACLLDIALLILAFELLIRAERARVELAARSNMIVNLNSELVSANASLEARVAERTRELEVSNKELEAFSYSVSHDLRAPLRTIDGFSLALKEDFADKLNDEGLDYINRVRGGVQRMGSLIDALLQLSRVTRSEVQRERFDLSQLATNVCADLAAGDPERKVQWVAQPGVWAFADPRLLRVALENLLGNAWKFTSKIPEARIEFGASERDGKPVYFIRDNGAGFDMQYVDRLFTAFQRLHGDRDFKGSGIGLATVSRIIRRHHGTISAESEVGNGATFYFSLGEPPAKQD